jgi:hypothetical protein
MGVMLSLDRHRPANGRRRAQHARREDGWARARTLATVRRRDPRAGARLLSRLIGILPPWRDRAVGGRPPSHEHDRYRGAEASRGGRDAGRAPAA